MNTTLPARHWKALLGIWMALVIIATFIFVPSHAGLGNLGRIIIIHVPTAWVTVLAFLVAAIWSGIQLKKRDALSDARAAAAAEGGLLFSILATATGSIFAKAVWGSFWNWDPREVSIFVLLLIYAAYFALRSAIEDIDRRRRLSAVYSLLAFVTVPFLIFVVPRIADSTLHPNCALLSGSKCDGVVVGQQGSGAPSVTLLGDRKIALLSVKEEGDLVSVEIEVTEPGASSKVTLRPSLRISSQEPVDMPEFPGSRFHLKLDKWESGQAHLNVENPSANGLLVDTTTLLAFLASIVGFTGLFFWIYRVRSRLLFVAARLEELA